MKPGPKPKPTSLKIAEGNPGKRPLPTNEPTPPAAIPTPPEELDKKALQEWERIAPTLAGLGILTNCDRSILAAHCLAVSRWLRSEAQVAELGEVVKSPSGYPIQNPWLAIANKAHEQMKRTAAELGLTPSSRASLAGATVAPAAKPTTGNDATSKRDTFLKLGG